MLESSVFHVSLDLKLEPVEKPQIIIYVVPIDRDLQVYV